jgi:hypothetical protein
MLFGFPNHTPVSLALLVVASILVLAGPRDWILSTILAVSVLVSNAPHVVIFGQHFMVHRFLLLCAWARVLTSKEPRDFERVPLDKAFVLFAVWMLIGDTLLWQTLGAFIYQVANSICDGLGLYFLCRILLRERADLQRVLVAMVAVCVVVAGFMSLERVTQRNWLSCVGALVDSVQVREGRLRCQAAFSTPITAGTFGAVLLPLFFGLWWQGGKMKRLAVAGCVAVTFITFTASSGGPLLTYTAAIFGLMMWRVRDHMRIVRWAAGLSLLALHLVMKAPVWALIGRIHVIPGSSSYHRYEVIDTFVDHFKEWWFLGVRSTGDWAWCLDDVANQYCVAAKHGGLLSLILLLGVIVMAFKEVGARRQEVRGDPEKEFIVWSFGVMLWAHCVSFVGISYFDQTKVLWYYSLAMISSLHLVTESREAPLESVAEDEFMGQETSPARPGISLG